MAGAEQQKQIDFSRGEQLAAIREAALPAVQVREGSRTIAVQPSILKGVLRAIDDYGRGREAYPSRASLARSSGLSVRAVTRGLAALVELGVLIVERRKAGDDPHSCLTINHYRVVWSELAVLCPTNRRRRATVTRVDQSATERYQSATERYQRATVAPEPLLSAQGIASPPAPTGQPTWQAAAAELARLEIGTRDRIVRQWRRDGRTPADLLTELRESLAAAALPENRAKLTRPIGAVAYRLLTGDWPAAGIVTLSEAQARRERRQEASSDAARKALQVQIIRAGRRAQASDEQIRERLLAELGAEFCEANPWA